MLSGIRGQDTIEENKIAVKKLLLLKVEVKMQKNNHFYSQRI